ncbi:YciI family protein [Methylobacterium oxalidis]|uniref:YciI family protein n=1 Tax=Methylobacterium oxalidis TaxID=944322 RepID=UPI0033155A32
MPYFLLRLSPPRPAFPFDATEAEKALFGEHAAYWIARADAGEAIAVGPVFEASGAWGLALVEAADEAAALALGEADPVIRARTGFSYAVSTVPSLILRPH